MADAGNRVVGRVATRADQDINAGHSRGLAASLAKTESEIRNLRTERIYAFDKNGKLISHSTSGTGSSTQLLEGHDYTDTIVTHNHPGNYLEGRKNLATRIGTSFSADDIIVATAHNVKEMHAVTRQGYTYSIKRKGDKWQLANKPAARMYLLSRYDDLYEHTVRKYRDAMWIRTDGTDDKYEDDVQDRIHIVATHQTLKQLAKEFDFSYTRKKTI
jgi:hypothetical protein